jgi:hypothetical protein
VNLQAPMVLAGDLNLSVKLSHASFDTEPFAIASSLGCPCKMGGQSLQTIEMGGQSLQTIAPPSLYRS